MEPVGKKVQVRLRIRGRVQGVYYRASAIQQAQSLDLSGWVMNCNDGSVELVAEGERSQLERLIAWCRQGPPGAHVTAVDLDWGAATSGFYGFTIRR